MSTNVPVRTVADVISYDDLYARWEKGNWSATALDFSEDKRQWEEQFDDFERKAALWNYALFFWGEDAVADGLSPYIDAAPREEQKYFLATQQVDEARHAVFFSRFMGEVAGIGGSDIGSRLDAIEPQLTWGFKKVFDRLETMCAELRRKPTIPRIARILGKRSPRRAGRSCRATIGGSWTNHAFCIRPARTSIIVRKAGRCRM